MTDKEAGTLEADCENWNTAYSVCFDDYEESGDEGE